MTKAEKFLDGEMTMRLSGRTGFQWCMWPHGDEPCYELLWPDQLVEVAHYGKRLYVCPHHKTVWDQLARPQQSLG